jgi:hypothetical protein
MVCCSLCDRWAHFVCGLFNSRRNLGDDVAFVCPYCILEKRKTSGVDILVSSKKMRAFDLPHSNLSQFIQRRVQERLEVAREERAAQCGKSIEDIESCPEICKNSTPATLESVTT